MLCVTTCSLVDGIDVSGEKKVAAFTFSTQKVAKKFASNYRTTRRHNPQDCSSSVRHL